MKMKEMQEFTYFEVMEESFLGFGWSTLPQIEHDTHEFR